MRNREERRENEPGKCASWNVGAICPEIPVYREACTTWLPKEGGCGLGYKCCYLPMTSKIPGITLNNFKPRYSFQTLVKCHLTPLKMSVIKEKREKNENDKHWQGCREIRILVHCW